jgi:4'-phosphopantetheinyl transferase
MSPAVPSRIDVWQVDLDAVKPDDRLLADDEKSRAGRFADGTDARRYRAGRTWLRTRLSEYTATEPGDIGFRYGRYGRPTITASDQALEFSLAHSGPKAVLAIGWKKPIGVDIERWQSSLFDPSWARLVLSASELALIDAADDKDRMFLKCWTRKEAYSKVSGMGLDRQLSAVTLTLPNQRAFHHEGHELFDWEWSSTTVAIAVPTKHQLHWR